MPLISVIIPAYNRGHSLARAAESALQQTIQDIEVIIVDDTSKDDTVAVAEQLVRSDGRVRLVRHETNRGAQAARNTGAHTATGQWLAFFDSDDWMLPASLETRLEVARKHNVKVVHTDGWVLRENQPQALFGIPPLRGSVYEALLRDPGPMFQGMLIAADAFRTIGGMDEKVVSYQEWDTAIRLARDYAFGFVSEPTFVYDCSGGDTISKNFLKCAQGYEYVVRKHRAEILFRTGLRACSRHYEIIADHYTEAGNLGVARKWQFKSFLWWPSPGHAIRKLKKALG